MTSVTTTLSSIFNRNVAVLTSNGTFALFAALNALDLPRNSAVMMPALCCPAVMTAIQMSGYQPIIADIDAGSLSMERKQIEDAYAPHCKAIIAVHAYGRPCNIKAIQSFCNKTGTFLIEDACLAYGNDIDGQPIGSFGDISVLSFGYDKPIDCGGGGAVMSDNAALASRLYKQIKSNPVMASPKTFHDNIQNSLLQLGDSVVRRIHNTATYCNMINNPYITLPEQGHAYWRLPLLVENARDKLVEEAALKGIIVTTHYPSLGKFSSMAQTPIAECIQKRILNVFVRPETPQGTIQDCIDFINGFQNG